MSSSKEIEINKPDNQSDRAEKRAETSFRSDIRPTDLENHIEAGVKEARAKKEFREKGGRTDTHNEFGTPTIEGFIQGGPPGKSELLKPNEIIAQAAGADKLLQRVLSPEPIGRVSKEFTNLIQSELRSLRPILQEALEPFKISTSQTPADYINEMRNHPGAATDPGTRTEMSMHSAMTDADHHLQNFSEIFRIPDANRTFRFDELFNLRGTVAHEAEHALDGKIGYPSQNDPEFDRLYRIGAERITAMRGKDNLESMAPYIVYDEKGDLVPGPGKSELFADLAAIDTVGEPANKLVNVPLLKEGFKELNEYIKTKIENDEW